MNSVLISVEDAYSGANFRTGNAVKKSDQRREVSADGGRYGSTLLDPASARMLHAYRSSDPVALQQSWCMERVKRLRCQRDGQIELTTTRYQAGSTTLDNRKRCPVRTLKESLTLAWLASAPMSRYIHTIVRGMVQHRQMRNKYRGLLSPKGWPIAGRNRRRLIGHRQRW